MKSKPTLPIKALIIDDEKDICWLLGNLLNRRNIESFFAASLKEAETLTQSTFLPSIIFLDNQLPDGLGVKYIGILKRKFPEAVIVMMTGLDVEPYRKEALTAGVDYFTAKPLSTDLIYKAIDSVNGNRRHGVGN